MTHTTRRGVLSTILVSGGALAFAPTALHAARAVRLPSGPLRLTRRIERDLVDGKQIIVERSWQVAFSPAGRDIAIHGQQLHARVDAPELLAPIAAIEESRSTDAMWPVILGPDGQIAAAGKDIADRDLAAVIREGEKILKARPMPETERSARLQYLSEMQRAGSSLLDRLPGDLFYPRLGPVRTVRSLEVPGGVTGEFELYYNAVPAYEHGWLDSAERIVTTRIGAYEQRACEYWQLSQTLS
ncbi:hypothetical protein [Qipengyuania nanhaisediminis]|uniref:hypothetical protein n=1 Tax=Qipengyuania nanhaisediminis TaxID=604088 RepID=UPI0038B40FF0